jgi:ParB-like chromosome segregation protein Spo0J
MHTPKDQSATPERTTRSGVDTPPVDGRPQYPVHAAADLFPLMSGEELHVLGEDMLVNGQREAIVLYRGQILDGRNRYRACILKGIEPRFREERPADVFAFVASANLHRRHLDASQRAMIAAELATLRDGERKTAASRDAATQTDAAKLLEVSRPSVQRARFVREHGVPELVDAVKSGDVRVKPAAEFAKAMPPLDQQRLIVDHGSAAAAVNATVKAKADRGAKAMPKKVRDPKPAVDRTEARAGLDAARATYVATVDAANLTVPQRANEIRKVVMQLYTDELPDFQHLIASSSGGKLN